MVWESIAARSESLHRKYVVIAGGRIQGIYDNAEDAAKAIRELRARGYRRIVLVRPGVDDKRERMGEWLGEKPRASSLESC